MPAASTSTAPSSRIALAASIEERAMECASRNESISVFGGDVEKLQRLLADVEAELLRQVAADRSKARS